MTATFEQQPKESAKAFAAFSAYLGMGPERSLEAVAQKFTKSSRLLKRWSRRFDWPGRVRAHADRLATVEREATEALARGKAAEWLKRQQALRETEWEMHEKCIAAARRGLGAFEAREKVYANLADIARMLEVASKLGRLASGMATDKTEITGEDGGPIRLELNAALNKVYGEVVDVEATALPAALPQGEGNNGLPGQRARGNPVAGELQPVPPADSGEKATP